MKLLKKRNAVLSVVVLLVILLTASFILAANLKILPKSGVDLSINDGSLSAKFNINQSDKGRFEAFLYNLGVSSVNQISLKLNQSALSALSQDLPTTLTLNISDKDIKFKNQTFTLLKGAIAQNFEIASGSGKLSITKSGDYDYSIFITDPAEVLESATSSAQLYLSDKIQGLFPILQRVATINLEVHGHSISGEIQLK